MMDPALAGHSKLVLPTPGTDPSPPRDRPEESGPPEASDRAGGDDLEAFDFANVYQSYFDFVWRSLRRLGVSVAELDDATQEVFLVVHRRLTDFERRSSMKTWLFGIVFRVASQCRRTRRRHPEQPLPAELPARQDCDPHEATGVRGSACLGAVSRRPNRSCTTSGRGVSTHGAAVAARAASEALLRFWYDQATARQRMMRWISARKLCCCVWLMLPVAGCDLALDVTLGSDIGGGAEADASASAAGADRNHDRPGSPSFALDSGSADTGSADTGSADTGSADTGSADTGSLIDSGETTQPGDDGGALKPWSRADPGIREMELDATHVFGVADGTFGNLGIWRAERATRTVEPLVRIPNQSGGERIYALAVDETHVYFTHLTAQLDLTGGSIRRVAKAGGSVEILVSGIGNPTSIAVDETHVYFTIAVSPTGEVWRAPKTGGRTETLLVDVDNPWDLAVDATHVYVSEMNRGRIVRTKKTGGTAEILGLALFATGWCRIADDYVYFQGCVTHFCEPDYLYRVPRVGGAVEVVQESSNDQSKVASIPGFVVWSRWLFPINGNGAVELFPTIRTGVAIAADERGAYFGDVSTGEIFFVSLPPP